MINYGGGIAKTNKSIKDMNKKGKSLMGSRNMPVVKAGKAAAKKKKAK